MNLLEVTNISKQYTNFALENISFSLPAGYIMGYVGQNGAGKTTTLNIITHLVRAANGNVSIDGLRYEKDPIRYLDCIGYVGDSSYFPEIMTVGQVRSVLRDFYPSFRPREFDRYVDRWKLPLKDKIKNFSRGTKVKLMFASVLARDTKLLILDEATNGLDPMMRKEVLELLQEYISDGSRSVLFSTHILADLEQIADYIFFIDHGKKIFCGVKEDLTDSYLLVKGGREDLTAKLRPALIGVEKNDYGFEALYDVKSDILLPAGLITEKPSIDQIVVHLFEDMRY